MIEVLIISIGLLLIVEGTIYFLFADRLETLINMLKNFSIQKIKTISLCIALIGLCLIYFTFKVYNDFE